MLGKTVPSSLTIVAQKVISSSRSSEGTSSLIVVSEKRFRPFPFIRWRSDDVTRLRKLVPTKLDDFEVSRVGEGHSLSMYNISNFLCYFLKRILLSPRRSKICVFRYNWPCYDNKGVRVWIVWFVFPNWSFPIPSGFKSWPTLNCVWPLLSSKLFHSNRISNWENITSEQKRSNVILSNLLMLVFPNNWVQNQQVWVIHSKSWICWI